MKTKIIIWLILVFCASETFAYPQYDNCYNKLTIAESINLESNTINLRLTGIDKLYGNYSIKAEEYNNNFGDYLIKTYDENNQNIGNRSTYSNTYFFYDDYTNEENPGGIDFDNESTTSLIIPYDNRIKKITAKINNVETTLNFDPSQIGCERTCKIENETGNMSSDTCCPGLIKAEIDNTKFNCITCGDRICSANEDEYNCPADCTEICDAKDNNNDGAIDENCDNDKDLYVDKNMICQEQFFSPSNTLTIELNNTNTKVNLSTGWNLVGFPTKRPVLLANLTQQCQITRAVYKIVNSNYIIERQQFTQELGYWIYALSPCSFDLSPYEFDRFLNINLSSGWNLISGVKNTDDLVKRQGVIWNWNQQAGYTVARPEQTSGIWVNWNATKPIPCRKDINDNDATQTTLINDLAQWIGGETSIIR